MELRLRIFLILGSIIVLFYFISMIYKGVLEIKHTLVWFLADIGIILLCIIPTLLKGISRLLGIVEPVNTVFLIGILFLCGIVFYLTVSHSKSAQKIKDLAQKISLLEKQIIEKQRDFHDN